MNQVSGRIREDLVKRAKEFNIMLEDVSITHLSFGQEFTHAVEQKQVMQQEAERARFVVEKVCRVFYMKKLFRILTAATVPGRARENGRGDPRRGRGIRR